ncbi:MAG: hypothetical protein AAFS05_09105 [Pseudomonadota bacterium]
MTTLTTRYASAVFALLAVLLLAGAVLAPLGYISIDEFVYDLGARALAQEGRLATDNGYETFGSRDLVFLNMVAGPNGIVPQYPIGSALFGAPFYAALGLRGMFVLNALAALLMLFVTRALARAFYGDDAVAMGAVLILALGTYFADYAWAVWPHMPGALAVTLGMLLIWRATFADAPGDLRYGLLAGLVIGIGFLFRTDTMLIVPAFGALVLLYARRPFHIGFAGLAGLIPALVVAAIANELKFGTWNPVSYGTTGGSTNLGKHLPALVLLIVGVAAIGGMRAVAWRASWRWPAVVVGIAVLVAVWALVPQAQAFLNRYGFGAWNLVGDMRLSPDNRAGITPREDGTVSFWGLPKKGLGQSLPWLGLVLLVYLRPWGARRAAQLFTLATLAIWTLPFFLLAWHGGLSGNMRYFLPILPVLAILGALGLADLARAAPDLGRSLLIGAAIGITAVFAWMSLGRGGLFGAHQILTIYALIGVSAVIVGAALVPAAARAGQFAAGAGLGMALVLGPLQDVSNSWSYRANTSNAGAVLAGIDAPTVIYGPPSFIGFQIDRPQGLIAQTMAGRPPDTDFITEALGQGYAVYMLEPWMEDAIAADPRLAQNGPAIGVESGFKLYPVGLR